jgi:hypothetical protein
MANSQRVLVANNGRYGFINELIDGGYTNSVQHAFNFVLTWPDVALRKSST